MEQMETCLEKLLKERGAYFEEHILARIALCTLEALEYLKSRENLMHRDIKPSNILGWSPISATSNCEIISLPFELSKMLIALKRSL